MFSWKTSLISHLPSSWRIRVFVNMLWCGDLALSAALRHLDNSFLSYMPCLEAASGLCTTVIVEFQPKSYFPRRTPVPPSRKSLSSEVTTPLFVSREARWSDNTVWYFVVKTRYAFQPKLHQMLKFSVEFQPIYTVFSQYVHLIASPLFPLPASSTKTDSFDTKLTHSTFWWK